ncbi:MAG: type II toxin-antitoxin system PemK/MazF family toxin [Butyrivibrio sp.]|nr:type II toxin-antitoxin system PemK/MazF family toxin [Butyrivibrio sp.]
MREVKRGDIYLADLGDNLGSVQRGECPVIIVQNNRGNIYSPTVTVIPITTKIHRSKGYPTHAILDHMGGLSEASASMAEQITTINKGSLKKYLGSLSESFMKTRINKTMRIQMGMESDIEKKPPDKIAKPDPTKVPIWHKASMTVDEAAEYSNIGVNKIRELCKDPLLHISFQIGRKILIKRAAFDEYLNNIELI